MLLLSRAEGQTFTIETPAGLITIAYMGPNSRNPHLAMIGIEAPRDWPILRLDAADKAPKDTLLASKGCRHMNGTADCSADCDLIFGNRYVEVVHESR